MGKYVWCYYTIDGECILVDSFCLNVVKNMYFCILFVTVVPFISKILSCKSVAIVGLEKNTGKTVCLNYVLRRIHQMGLHCAVTSIGVDGEQVDSVYATAKPEVTLYDNTFFVTSERHYSMRRLVSTILDVGQQRTALGRLVTAKVLSSGKALLSGPATTDALVSIIDSLACLASSTVIVDGALSRLSLASPTVTQGLVLATGAAVSPSIPQLVSKTRFACSLINLPEVDEAVATVLGGLSSGIWAIDSDNVPHSLGVDSVFLLDSQGNDLFRFGTMFYVPGAVTDRLIKMLSAKAVKCHLVVRDFTKLFVTQQVLYNFFSKGGRVSVLRKSNLLALTLNPTSPQGFRLDSRQACDAVADALQMPVYDVCQQII